MFCVNCGAKAADDAKFCINCGAARTYVQNTNAQAPEAASAVTRSGMNKLKIILPVTLAVLIAAIVLTVFMSRVGPLLAVRNSINNLVDEMTLRIEGTPFHAFGLLSDVLNDGTISVGVEYDDRWTSFSGDFTLRSNAEEREFALLAEIDAMGLRFDAEARLNRERFAARTNLLGDEFYGFYYRTFRQDIREFGRFIGLDNETMDILSDVVEAIEEGLNTEPADLRGDVQPYVDLLTDFILSSQHTSERTEIMIGGQNTRVTRVDMLFDNASIIGLMHDYVNLLSRDQDVRERFDTFDSAMRDIGEDLGMSFDDVIDILWEGVDLIEEYFSANVRAVFYVGSGDRLVRVRVRVDLEYDGEEVTLSALLNLGRSTHDTWTLELSMTDDWGDESVLLQWRYDEQGSNIINSFGASMANRHGGAGAFWLTSNWNSQSGAFRLYAEEEGRGTEDLIRGNFMPDGGGGFRLTLTEFGGFTDLSLDITASPGAGFERINFVNIDRWDTVLMDGIEDLIWDLMWGMMF